MKGEILVRSSCALTVPFPFMNMNKMMLLLSPGWRKGYCPVAGSADSTLIEAISEGGLIRDTPQYSGTHTTYQNWGTSTAHRCRRGDLVQVTSRGD